MEPTVPLRAVVATIGAWVELVQSVQAVPTPELEIHLRHPASGGPLRGSELGSQLWGSDEGRALLDAALSDELLLRTYGPPPDSRLMALRGRITALTIEALGTDDPKEHARTWAAEMLRECALDGCVGMALWLVRGLTVSQEIRVTDQVFVIPATDEAMMPFLNSLPAGATTVPSDATAVLVSLGGCDREVMGAYAAAQSVATAELVLHSLSRAVWLVTGCFPVPVMKVAWEVAHYTAVRASTDHMSYAERGRQMDAAHLNDEDVVPLRETLSRLFYRGWARDDSIVDDVTVVAIESALRLIDAALPSPDGLVTNLACYAAIDGVISGRAESDQVTIRRVPNLLTSDSKRRRVGRRLIQHLYELRGEMAHGRRPNPESIAKALGQEFDADPFRRPSYDDELRMTSLRLARVVLAFTLTNAVAVQDADDSASIPSHHGRGIGVAEVRRLLDACHAGNADANHRIAAMAPLWIAAAAETLLAD